MFVRLLSKFVNHHLSTVKESISNGDGEERQRQRRPAYLLSVALFLFAAQPANASEVDPGWLEYSAPPECPNVAHIEQRVGEWLSGRLPGSERLRVEGALSWTGHNWRAVTSVTLDGTRTERAVEVETCLDAADFVALTTVLTVEPENALGDEPQGPAAAPLPHENGRAAPPKEAAPAPTPLPPSPKPDAAAARGSGFMGMSAFLRSGSLPELHPGVAVRGGFSWQRVRGGIEVRAAPPLSSRPAGAAAPIEFSLYSLAISSCYAWAIQRFSLGPCLAVEGGALISDQAGDGPNRSAITTPWFGLVPGLEGTFEFARAWRISASAGISVPLTRVRLELSDGSLAHQAEVGADATLGVAYFF